MQRKTVAGLVLTLLGAALLIFGGAEIYLNMSTGSHGLTLYHLTIVACGLAALGGGTELTGLVRPSQSVQQNEIAHSRWATAQDLIAHNIADQS